MKNDFAIHNKKISDELVDNKADYYTPRIDRNRKDYICL